MKPCTSLQIHFSPETDKLFPSIPNNFVFSQHLPTPCLFWGSRLQKGIGATVVWIMPGSSFIARDTCLDLLHDILAGGARQDFHLRRGVDPTGRPWAFHGTRSAQECQQSHTWSHAELNQCVICLSRVFQPNAAESNEQRQKNTMFISFAYCQCLCGFRLVQGKP